MFTSSLVFAVLKLESEKLMCLMSQDLLSWTNDKQEVEVVDLILRIKDKLVRLQSALCYITVLVAYVSNFVSLVT